MLKGVGCGACSGRILVKGINDIPTTAPWMVKYFPGGEEEASNFTRSCSKTFTPICPFCGRVSDIQISPNRLYHQHGISCICKDGITIPNKIIRNIMEQALRLNMISSFEKEYKLYDERGTLRKFDMYFADINQIPYLVEMDGGKHSYIKRNHSKKKFCFVPAKSLLIDDLKDNIAKNMGITLIRIDCFKSDVDYIKDNIYKSTLFDIINLDRIDWLEVEEICYGNIIEEVCKYKRDHPEVFAPEVCDMFDISSTTLRKYWKIGNRLGLCEYHPELEGARRNTLPRDLRQCVGIYIENLDTG